MTKEQLKSYYEWQFEANMGCGNETYTVTEDLSGYDLWPFFRTVAKELAMEDVNERAVTKIVFRGREYRYVGWQAGMKFEFVAVDDAESFVVWMPEYDH